MEALFTISTITAIFSTIMVITRKNAVHALLYLVVSFFAVAMLFYLGGAPFVAVMEVIIYAGAIVTLFIFVVMMFNIGKPLTRREKGWLKTSVWLPPLILSVIILGGFVIVLFNPPVSFTRLLFIGPREVGYKLITRYMPAIELTGMLLMTGIIGAYHLGRKKKKTLHRYLEKTNES